MPRPFIPSLSLYPTLLQEAAKHIHVDDAQFRTVLCSLGYIALLEPTVFESSSIKVPQQKDKGWAGIIKTVVNNLLMKNKMPGTDADDEPEWQEPSPECEAKVRRGDLFSC